MEKRYWIYPLLALALSSCGSEGEQDHVEVYLSEGCLSTKPSTVLPDEIFYIPDWLTNVLKPGQEDETGKVYKDTLDLKTTVTDYRLMIRSQSAELTVNIQAKMQAREMRQTANYYVFRAGWY